MADHVHEQAHYSIKEAALLVSRSELTIRRRIDKGRFPGAQLRRGSSGNEWRIPAADLAEVARQDGWTMMLDLTDDQESDRQPDQLLNHVTPDLLAVTEAKVIAESEIKLLSRDVQSLTDQNTQLTRERDQSRRDLEHTRAELDQTTVDLIEQIKATAVAEARVEELRHRAEYAEKLRSEAVQERNSLDQEHRELKESSAETIDTLSSELETAETLRSKASDVRDALVKKVAEVESSMGWRARRRYGKKP